MTKFDYDVLVVGSGFGGSVTALRASEKGYRVGVIESGRRFGPDDFAKTSWNLRKYMFMPALGLRGIQRLNILKDVVILSGAGVGGGSLVYSNTLYEPRDPFYVDPQWGDITEWKQELAPHYKMAKKMLGVAKVPYDTPADEVMRKLAKELKVEDTFKYTDVGIFFGEPGKKVADPFFGGFGPERSGCVQCGGCMVGCRHGAKNTLDKNYLYLAEKFGAKIYPETKAVDLWALPGGGYAVKTIRPGSWFFNREKTLTAEQVVFSAGVLGTMRLLMKLKDEKRLPNLSDRLGDVVRTNSEAIVGATARKVPDFDLTKGASITSSIFPDENTHIEPCRYPKGSNTMGLLSTMMVDGGGKIPRQVKFLLRVITHPREFIASLSVRRWSERAVILLVMQSIDNSMKLVRKRGFLTTRRGSKPAPTYLPIANKASRIVAKELDGDAWGSWGEALLDIPTTAHIIGGACIGKSADEGVIDPYHRIYGHPGLYVADGSAISANLGVNPSLTITALTERAMSFWPNKGEADPRPPLGEKYVKIEAVRPKHKMFDFGAN